MLVKNKKQAIEVFKVNASLYPNSADACLKLAMAYKNTGEKHLAIENFRRCLDLDPQNKIAAEQLKNLNRVSQAMPAEHQELCRLSFPNADIHFANRVPL